jgi:hypothetical protein
MNYEVWARRTGEENWTRIGATERDPTPAVVRGIFNRGWLPGQIGLPPGASQPIMQGSMYEVVFRDEAAAETGFQVGGQLSAQTIEGLDSPVQTTLDPDA